jgi:hypothetical protein
MSARGWNMPRCSAIGLVVCLASTGCFFGASALPDQPVGIVAPSTRVAVLVFPRIEPSEREQIERVIAGITPLVAPKLGTPTPSPTVVMANPQATAEPTTSSTHVMTFTPADVQRQLTDRLVSEGSQLREATVELVEPDEILVKGRLPPPAGVSAAIKSIPIEVAFGIEVASAAPRITLHRLSSKGFKLPEGSQEALRNRIVNANKEAPLLVPPGEKVLRIWIQGGLLRIELDRLG